MTPWTRTATTRPGGAAIAVLVISCTAVELALLAADLGLIGPRGLRGLAYQNGAFWAGLVRDWRPNYVLQPYLMFLSYAFLHGGLLHLATNMITLAVLGRQLIERAGQAAFVTIYFASAIGGAALFGLLADSASPMVGASGALFGLAGALSRHDHAERRRLGHSTAPVWWTVAGLAVLNVVLWVALQGLLAWETHAGGFIAGWLTAATLARARRGGEV